MLSKVTIKNFKSIEDLTLDLTFAEGKAPNGYKTSNILLFLEATSKPEDRLVPIVNIYGANASGKSNIILALFCFEMILLQGIKALPLKLFSTNKLKNLGNETVMQLDFFLKKRRYQYYLSYSQYSISEEKLLLDNEELFSIKNGNGDFKGIEIKGYSNDDLKRRFEISCLSTLDGKKMQINTFLSSVTTDLPSLSDHLNLVSRFLKESLVVSLNNEILADFSIDQLAKTNKEEDIKEAFDRISDFIKRLDIDIERFKYEQKKDMLSKYEVNKDQYRIPAHDLNKSIHINKEDNLIRISEIKSFHKNDKGKEVSFGLYEESVGTRIAFGLIGTMLKVLDKGGVLIIDELDRSLHTLVLKSLMRIFKDKEYNKNNAQLICVLHNTDILDDDIYKMSEFSFVNKNLKRGSFIKRLSDFEGIRNDMNFRDRYLNGLYSGIPYPFN